MTAILQQLSLIITAIASLLSPSLLGAAQIERVVNTTLIRVETVKENLNDTQIKVQTDLSLPLETADKDVHGKLYTAGEYTQLKQQMGGKVRNFKNEPSTTNEEISIIFDLLNQCAKEITMLNNENTNELVAGLVEC